MLLTKEAEVSKVTEKLSTLQEEGQKDSGALEAAQQHFKAVSAGLSTNEDGEAATLDGQLMACKNDMSKADTEAKQVRGTGTSAAHAQSASCSPYYTHPDGTSWPPLPNAVSALLRPSLCPGPDEAEARPGGAEDQAGGGEEDGQRL